MSRGIRILILGALAALSMGGTCRQETVQASLEDFFGAIATTVGTSIGQTIADRTP